MFGCYKQCLAPDLFKELVALNAPKRLTESLRAGWLEGRAQMAHWYSMLLANVSTCKKGQDPKLNKPKRIRCNRNATKRGNRQQL